MTAPPLITHDTPFGTFTITASQVGLTRATLRTVRHLAEPTASASPTARRWLDLARRELDGYFAGHLRTFTVPVDLDRLSARRRAIGSSDLAAHWSATPAASPPSGGCSTSRHATAPPAGPGLGLST